MKKTLLFGLLTLAGLGAQAQIANGTVAPDFTATDINGQVHHLQEYLDQGKTVIMDISATWCAPCWGYHNSHILEKMYYSYGQGGSEEVVVLFVEGDNTTTDADLHGTGTNTQGDWVAGSPYPIIDNGSISQMYNLEHFPTILRICPNGIMTEVGQTNYDVVQLKNLINTGCSTTLAGVANHAELHSSDFRACDVTGNVVATVTNFGNNALTSATVELRIGDDLIATENYAGSLATYGSATVTFSGVTFDPSVTYTTIFTDINGGTPFSEEISSSDFHVTLADESNNNLQVRVYTDNWPTEITWKIKNSTGTVVASGGPYIGSAQNGGGLEANKTMFHDIVLEEGIDCYNVEMLDGYGDGWSLGTTQHGLEIFNAGGVSVAYFEGGNFGSSKIVKSAFKTNNTLGNDEVVPVTTFAIYPNPSNGIFNFATNEAVTVTVFDLTGKVVFTAKDVNNGDALNLSALQKGMYIAKVNGENSERTEKLVIN